MKPLICDLNNADRDIFGLYGGKSGRKYGIIIDGERWMVKFPREKKEFCIPSYLNTPINEYIGSQVYASLGILVQKVILGFRDGKIVVACKDFNLSNELINFEKIKNSMAQFDGTFVGGPGACKLHGEFLCDVLTVIEHSELLKKADGMKEQFWDMFIADGFICNNHRSNEDWGIMVQRDGTVRLAPVFDNGDSFFSKRGLSVAGACLRDEEIVVRDVLGKNVSFFLYEDGRHIHPFEYIQSLQNPDCTAALIRFSERLDMNRVRGIIEDIPERAFDLDVITREQKSHYIRTMEIIVEQSINPTLERLGHVKISLSR